MNDPLVIRSRRFAARHLPPDAAARSKRALARLRPGSLPYLAVVYGTDKGNVFHMARGPHGYTRLYERHLRGRRHDELVLFEIGVLGGASLRMWRTYFPRARIYGLDLDRMTWEEPRIRTFVGSQNDTDLLEAILDEIGPPDVVIDDGSHVGTDIIATFETVFPRMRSGGVFVIEDMQTAYDPAYAGGPAGTPHTSVALVKDLLDAVNGAAEIPVAAVHAYEKIAFIERR